MIKSIITWIPFKRQDASPLHWGRQPFFCGGQLGEA
jgi:hypothetical protein